MFASNSSLVRSWLPAICLGVVFSLPLLAGCDSATLDGAPADASMLAGGSDAQARVDVCHVNGQGDYIKITIAEAAYATHVAHGDANVGDEVPDQSGFVFDGDCQPVEQGFSFAVGSDGGVFSTAGGTVTLDIPEGAVVGDIELTVLQKSDNVGTGSTVPGTVFEFGPSPYSFNQPVTLTIVYDPDNLPGLASELSVLKLVSGTWIRVSDSSVDVQSNSVSAPINGFSSFGVGIETPVVTSIAVTPENAIVYHSVGNVAEPDTPGTQQFSAAVFDQFGEVMVGEDVTWFSSDDDVATVNEFGLATSVGLNGHVEITALIGEITGSGTLEVIAGCVGWC